MNRQNIWYLLPRQVFHKALGAMKLTLLATMLAMATPAPILNSVPPIDHKPGSDARELYHCRLKAVHAADNDIRLDRDIRSRPYPTMLPAIVTHKILAHVTNEIKRYFTPDEWRKSRQSCATVFSKIFYVSGPAGLQLYVAHRYFAVSDEADYFVMYDPRTGAITRTPPLISTKWDNVLGKDDWLNAPIVRIQPAHGGLPPLLIVEQQVHNGTDYNAIIYHYFEIGNDMSLTQILAVEARAILQSYRDEYTVRNATFLGSNRVRLDISSRSRQKSEALGSVSLERAQHGQPFHVVRRIPARGGDTEGLVTYCESTSDDDFLRAGCDS